MTTFDLLNVAWPWVGLGMAIVLLFVLFKTDVLRSNEGSRWRDLVWLAWLAVPVYMIHQFEEYALHISDWNYAMVDFFYSDSAPFAKMGFEMNLPLAHFPLVNIVFVWVGLPIAAMICRKNPVIGVASYGLILANAMMHVVSGPVLGMSVSENAGFFTGLFLFIPLAVWVIMTMRKTYNLPIKAIVISIVSGILCHISLFACVLFGLFGLPAGTIIMDFVTGFVPIIAAWLLCKIFKVKFD